jgi:hypothetical protein
VGVLYTATLSQVEAKGLNLPILAALFDSTLPQIYIVVNVLEIVILD